MKLKLLILALFPIMLFGQANLKFVRSIDSTFTILDQNVPIDTLWKFTKSGYLIKYSLNLPYDTILLKSDIESFRLDSSVYSDTAGYALNYTVGLDSIYDMESGTWITDTIPKSDSTWQSGVFTNSVTADTAKVDLLYNSAALDITAVSDVTIKSETQNIYLDAVNKRIKLDGAGVSGHVYLVQRDAEISLINNSIYMNGSDALDLYSADGDITIESNYEKINLISGDNSLHKYIIYKDTLFADGANTSTPNTAKFKNFFANLGGFFGRIFEGDKATFDTIIAGFAQFDSLQIARVWITGVDTSNTFEIDTLKSNVQIWGEDTVIGVAQSKEVIEGTPVDKFKTDTLILNNDTITGGSKEMSMYIYNASITIPIIEDVYSVITGWTEGYNQDNYFTVLNDSVLLTPSDYSIEYDLSYSGSSTDINIGKIYDDGIAITTGGGFERGMSGTDSGVIRVSWKGTISSTSYMSFRMTNTANGNDPTITYGNISIRKIK